MASCITKPMINANPRSVLRPEYLSQCHENPVPIFRTHQIFHSHLNTNTAPIYQNDINFRRNFRHSVRDHPYARDGRDRLNYVRTSFADMYPDRRTTDHPAHRYSASTVPSRSYQVLHSNSRHQAPLRTATGDSSVGFRSSQNQFRKNRSQSQGHAEQMRRSRESSTFALIDSHFSRGPFKKVKDMYMRTRTGTNAPNNAVARTTKKVNLSVLHTVVRFRMRSHLCAVQNHIDRLLDALLSKAVDDYHPGLRDSLASKMYGINRVSCAPDCRYCIGSREVNYAIDESIIEPEAHDFTFPNELSHVDDDIASSSVSSDNSTTPMRCPSEIMESFSQNCLSNDYASDCSLPSSSNVTCKSSDNSSQPAYLKFDPPSPAPVSDKSLLSYHLSNENIEDQARTRTRLDSLTLRLVDEFNSNDWSAEEIDLGPCGEEPIDLNSLVNDPLVIGKQEDLNFGIPFDSLDIVTFPYGTEKLPILQELCGL